MICAYLSYDRQRDTERAEVVRAAWVGADRKVAGVFDAMRWQAAVDQDAADHSTEALRSLIDDELSASAVTIVLVGEETAARSYVDYEIAQSVDQGNPVFGIRIEAVDVADDDADRPGLNPLPIGSAMRRWNSEGGSDNLVSWVREAIDAAT